MRINMTATQARMVSLSMSDVVYKAYNFAYYLTGDSRAAEQIVANSIKSLGPGEAPPGSACEKLFKGIYREFLSLPDDNGQVDTPGKALSGNTSMIAALKRLPPPERAHIVLRDILGYKTRDIALYLGKDEAAARTYISRARLNLARQMRSNTTE